MIVILVEAVNIEIILTSTDPLNLVYNFIAITIIAEFDDFVFSALRNEPMKYLIKETVTDVVLKIQHTTSVNCSYEEASGHMNEDGEPTPLRVRYSERKCGNKCAYL